MSPGGLPGGLHDEEFGHKSVRRNHIIADLLARTRYIEKAGTGINRIKQDAEQNNCNYDIEYKQDWFTVVFYRQSTEKSSEKSSTRILKLIQSNPLVTIQELADKLGITTRAIENSMFKFFVAKVSRKCTIIARIHT